MESAKGDRLVRAVFEAPPPALGGAPRLRLAAVGKAAGPMTAAFVAWAGDRLRGGVVVAPDDGGPADAALALLPSTLAVVRSSHPKPDARSEQGARHVLEIAAAAAADGSPLVVLLSGGASSLMALPAAGLRLEDKAEAARRLMHAGAAIGELNAVRKHLSAIKGGRLAAAAAGPVVTLALSDVVSPVADDPSVIGSGPTVADPTTFVDALAIVERYGVRDQIPPGALAVLRRGAAGEIEETIKPGDARLARSEYHVIGSRLDAVAGARRAAEARGYTVTEVPEPLVGEAREAGASLMALAVALAAKTPGPLCVLAAGETTVQVRGEGRGGRNQEMALAAALAAPVDPPFTRAFALASAGTDGVDGPTDAAGAVVDPGTLARAARAGLGDPRAYLDRNDSYRFFEPLGDLINTGPTGTNVGDLQVVLIG